MTVHQFVAVLSPNDAQFNHAFAIRDILRGVWPGTRIWADHFPIAEMSHEVMHYPWYADAARPGDVLFYHASTDSPLNAWLLERPEPLVVVYHNVTPADYAEPFAPFIAERLQAARRQIARLAPRTSLAFGVSSFNCRELTEWGFPAPSVMPIHLDLSRYRLPVDTRLLAALRRAKGDGPGIVFPGRIAPNKAQHDLLRVFRVLLEKYPTAKLWCPGFPFSLTYLEALRKYRAALGIPHGCFPGTLTQAQYLAYLHAADVVLSLSEHEGFWIPGVEAMACGAPVIAYSAGAVPETVAGAGMLIDTKDPFVVAAAVERVFEDPDLRRRMVAAGRKRVADLDSEAWGQRLLDALASIGA